MTSFVPITTFSHPRHIPLNPILPSHSIPTHGRILAEKNQILPAPLTSWQAQTARALPPAPERQVIDLKRDFQSRRRLPDRQIQRAIFFKPPGSDIHPKGEAGRGEFLKAPGGNPAADKCVVAGAVAPDGDG